MQIYQMGERICQVIICTLFCYIVIFSPSIDVVPWIVAKYDDKRFLEILLVCAVLFYGVMRGKALDGYGYGYLFLLILLVVSCIFSYVPRYAFIELALFVGLFFYAHYIKKIWILDETKMLIVIVGSVSLGVFLYLVTFCVGYAASFFENIPLRWPASFMGFSNVRFFNQYQIWGFSLLAIPLTSISPLICKYKKLLMALLVGWWVLLFVSAGRGALLAIGLALLMTLTVYRRESFDFVRLQVLSGFWGFVIYAVLFYVPTYLFSAETGISTVLRPVGQGRLELWHHAINLIVQNPFFGVGPMHYAWYLNDVANHPHNSVLQIAAEWGLPAALFVLVAFFYGISCWLRRFNYQTLKGNGAGTKKEIIVALFSSLFAGGIYSVVSGIIVMPLSQVMGATIIGLMLGVYNSRGNLESCSLYKSSKPSLLRVRDLLLRLLSGATLVVFVWAVMPSLLPRLIDSEALSSRKLHEVGVVAKPRFWRVGEVPQEGDRKH